MTKLIVSDEAKQDIAEILAYLKDKAGSEVAFQYANAFENTADLVIRFPRIGALRGELGTNARITVIEPYVWIYDFSDADKKDIATVLRVLHGKRNITQELLGRP